MIKNFSLKKNSVKSRNNKKENKKTFKLINKSTSRYISSPLIIEGNKSFN